LSCCEAASGYRFCDDDDTDDGPVSRGEYVKIGGAGFSYRPTKKETHRQSSPSSSVNHVLLRHEVFTELDGDA
jgi:hypothetical protein